MGFAAEVAVVGAGPAGALCAYLLARSGAKVILFDAMTFPRSKPCGGGVQERATRHIPFEWQHLSRAEVNKAVFTCRLERPVQRESKTRLMRCVLRHEFDTFLVGQAVEAGAVLSEGEPVLEVRDGQGRVTLETKRRTVSVRFVVGADGANSIVGRTLNARSSFFWQAAVFAELRRDELKDPKLAESSTIRIDFGTLGAGYAWAFPKGEYLNVGVGGPSPLGRGLRRSFDEFLIAEGVITREAVGRIGVKGHQLPTLTKKTRVAGESIILVGDAAGLVEPLTGEGISYACQSAHIAAGSILSSLNGEEGVPRYSSILAREIGRQIDASRWLLSFATAFPALFYRMVERRESLWTTFCDVLRGHASFSDLRADVAKPFSFLARAAEPLLEGISERRMRGVRSNLARGLPWTPDFDERAC